jgi:RNA polymerase sigma factor (sigma-70 family)
VLPPELSRLLEASDPEAREAAWTAFLEVHSRHVMLVARAVYREYDGAMDGYAYLLEELQRDDYRRLRAYTPQSGSKFTTWLTVVARRLFLDQLRQRYGRPQAGDPADHRVRRNLVDLLADELDTAAVPSDLPQDNPEARLAAAELRRALNAAVGELEPSDRLLISLRFDEDLPAREIGRILGFATPFHVYRRLNAVLARLRAALRRRGVQESQA